MSTVSSKPVALVPIAHGSEEIETTTIIDTLVRGGIDVIVASVAESLQVKCSRGVNIVADVNIQDCVNNDYDIIVCPGGMPGAENLRNSEILKNILIRQQSQGKLIGAICAAPAVVLQSHNLIGNKAATCYPAEKFQKALANYVNDNVVVSDNIITSKGPATALPFALKLIELLVSKEKADSVGKEMLY
eukprot:gene16814-22298_t